MRMIKPFTIILLRHQRVRRLKWIFVKAVNGKNPLNIFAKRSFTRFLRFCCWLWIYLLKVLLCKLRFGIQTNIIAKTVPPPDIPLGTSVLFATVLRGGNFCFWNFIKMHSSTSYWFQLDIVINFAFRKYLSKKERKMKNKPDMLINGTRPFIINHSFIIKMTTKNDAVKMRWLFDFLVNFYVIYFLLHVEELSFCFQFFF